MPTKGERNALMFLAAVAVLGAATRLWRSSARVDVAPAAATALAHQITEVDSVRAGTRGGRGRKGGATPRRTSAGARKGIAVATPTPTPTLTPKVDVDWATSVALTRLPGIGPAIAARIVAERDAHGPFGCMAALRMVKGVGPALARNIDSLVTFSGPSRRDVNLCSR